VVPGQENYPRHVADGNQLGVEALDAMLDLQHPTKVAAARWGEAHLTPPVDRDRAWVADHPTWKAAADYGLLGLQLPVEHGGTDASATDIALTFEGLGSSSADNGVVFGVASQALTANRAVAVSGSPEQLARWAGPLGSGELIASFAMSEADAGSHPWSLATRAEAQPDGSWVLNGAKAWVTLGPICDVAVVFAATDPSRGQWGISAFIVESSTPGFERLPAIDKMGMHSCPFGELRFTDCRVGPQSLLGNVGAGASIFSRTVEAERAFLYASQVGATERAIHRAVDYARQRHQAGVHIGSHQAVSHRLVDAKLHHEAARLLLYKTTARYDRGESIALEAALTKLMASEHAVNTALAAMRTFGASGYTSEIGLEAELSDAIGGLAYSGTPDVTRNIVAAQLGLARPL
jgi:alkylation response protein AidB-like acyl-CoA dehydrogenase